MHMPGQPSRGTVPVFPTQAFELEPWPYVYIGLLLQRHLAYEGLRFLKGGRP